MPPGTKGVKVGAFEYRDQSDLGNYPIPPAPSIEGGGAATGDRHILFIDPRRCILYGFTGRSRCPTEVGKPAFPESKWT